MSTDAQWAEWTDDLQGQVDKLRSALEVAQGDLHMLKKAIAACDPYFELLVRVEDAERDVLAALAEQVPA